MKIHHEVDPLPLRAAAYPDIGEQLDAIMKGFDALTQQGFQLPRETLDWIERCKAVKGRYKKS
ncbi:hypothetical protein [Burkholderia vietnamiensis]|uniref:hypothetical protein n=1 Tax=Burkholderia vietnamiensis TaxID=60552 RepID=UPI001CB06D3B|nr:hypothetical protein [Burkholderia vietnamiensis]CAG9228921.1 conserved hypothetical protein [Burkholderia vietnamiensis]HDR9086349.1 hypothetical protein [Burkholderia vietnamiensis]